LTKKKLKVGLAVVLIVVAALGWYMVSYGAPDFFRPYYLLRKSSQSTATSVEAAPGEVTIATTIEGKGELVYVRYEFSGSGSDDALWFFISVDGEIMQAFYTRLSYLRYMYDRHTIPCQILRDDTTNDIYAVAFTLRLPFTEKAEIGVYNGGSTSYLVTVYIIYEQYQEVRETP